MAKAKPRGVENVIEQVIEGYDNAVLNEDKETEQWLNEHKLVFEFTMNETIVKEVNLIQKRRTI